MGASAEFFSSNLVYVFLVYGLSFIILAAVLSLQARVPVTVLPRTALGLLAAFALTHGVAEWTAMAVLIEASPAVDGSSLRLQSTGVFLSALSFALLAQFGIEALVLSRGWQKRLRALPTLVFLLWLIFFVLSRPSTGATLDWLITVEVFSRYFLGLPSSLLAAYAFLVASREVQEIGAKRLRIYLSIAAFAFAAYAFFAGLIVPPAPFPPASFLNTAGFLSVVGIPVQLFRAACALALAVALSEAFVIEAARARWQAEQLREEFISIVAHDLRSPITVISLNAELLEKALGQGHLGDRETAMARSIRISSRNLNRMTEGSFGCLAH